MAKQRNNYAITNNELKEWTKEFQKFKTPDKLMNLYKEKRKNFTTEEYFNRAGLNFLREAYITATYGQLLRA